MLAYVSIFFRQIKFEENYFGYIVFNLNFSDGSNGSKKFKFLIKNIVPIEKFEFSIQSIDENGIESDFGSFLTNGISEVEPEEFHVESNLGKFYILEDVTEEDSDEDCMENERLKAFIKERRAVISWTILWLAFYLYQGLSDNIRKYPMLKDEILSTKHDIDFNFAEGVPESKIKEWFK
ncbi:MAG: hypothetical protein WCW87_03625 [Candidatus Paceibacterota bacterium]